MEHQIRWKRGDYISLGKAVAKYNRKISELEKENNKIALLNKLDYKQEKENITTRKQLNKYKKTLQNINKDDALNLVLLPSGEFITKYHYDLLSQQEKTIERRLNNDLKNIDNILKPYKSMEELTIRSNLKAIKNWRNLKGQKLENMKIRLNFFSSDDVKMRKSIVYRENYINEMEKYKNFKNYDRLMKKLNSIKNPIEFYEKIKGHGLYDDLLFISDQYFTQAVFNSMVEAWGVKLEKGSDIVEDNIKEFWEEI